MFFANLEQPPSNVADVDSDEDDDIDTKYQSFLFAPDDTPTFLTKPKDDLFGIGYK